MAEEADPSLVEKFVSITGASESRAQALLHACNGNLEMAIGMHLEEDVEETESSRCHLNQLESADHTNTGEDNVRAPIPQTRGVLLEGPYRASRPRRRGNQSVFDTFRDFQAEAREQEMELSGRAGKNKRKTLQDLFKPPLDIMHKGTFDTAKVAGEQEGKWLMVNIQDSKEFSCQQLNRDVWSNDAVRNIMTEYFILWQVYHDSDDGDRYTQFYHVSKFPHIAILDPRTGEKLVQWDGVDAQSFCENATEFLSSHSLGKKTNYYCSSPPAKRRKRESIIDASEDSQLEAAIAASLKETSAQAFSSKNNNDDKQVDDTADDDSLTEFTESDQSDVESVSKTVSKDEKDVLDNNVFKNDVNKIESEKNSTNGNDSKRNECNTASSDIEETKQKMGENREESDEDNVDSGCVKAYVMLRYPNGRRKQKSFAAEATILDLVKYVQTEGFSNERYELVTNFPRKKLSYLDSDLSLKDAGLFPRETVFIQER